MIQSLGAPNGVVVANAEWITILPAYFKADLWSFVDLWIFVWIFHIQVVCPHLWISTDSEKKY